MQALVAMQNSDSDREKKQSASGLEPRASSNSHHFSDFLPWAEDKRLVPSMACPAICTWSNCIETMVDHSSFLKASSNVWSLSLLTSSWYFLPFFNWTSETVISDLTRALVFFRFVASRVQGDTFAYAAPFFAPGNGAVAFEHSSFTWHGLYSAGRQGDGEH